MNPTFTLRSPETGNDYGIFLHADRKPAVAVASPAVAFLDGDDQFAPAVAAYEDLREGQRIPPLLLVGVGYGASYAKPANRRGRDYTPTPHPDEPTSCSNASSPPRHSNASSFSRSVFRAAITTTSCLTQSVPA